MEKETVGLTEELTEYLTVQLENQRKKNSTAGRVIIFDDEGRPIEEGEEKTPAHLVEAVAVAVEMDRIKEMRAMPKYPKFFSPMEWACYGALIAARQADDANAAAERETQKNTNADRARLENLRRR